MNQRYPLRADGSCCVCGGYTSTGFACSARCAAIAQGDDKCRTCGAAVTDWVRSLCAKHSEAALGAMGITGEKLQEYRRDYDSAGRYIPTSDYHKDRLPPAVPDDEGGGGA